MKERRITFEKSIKEGGHLIKKSIIDQRSKLQEKLFLQKGMTR